MLTEHKWEWEGESRTFIIRGSQVILADNQIIELKVILSYEGKHRKRKKRTKKSSVIIHKA